MTDNNNFNEAVESIIFNPIIYGNIRIRNNIYGDVESAHNTNVLNIQTEIEISNNTKFTNNDDKIYIGENNYILNKDLLKIHKIDLIDDKIDNINTNFNNQITELIKNLDGYKIQTDNKMVDVEKNITKLFQNLEESKKTIIKRLSNNILMENIEADLYLVDNRIEIELPEINENILFKKFKITNTINKSSGIYCNKSNNIINLSKTHKKIELINGLTLTFYCIDKNNWLAI